MPISGNEGALKRAMRRARLVSSTGGLTRGSAVATAAILLGLFVWLHLRADDADTQSYTEVLAELAAVKLIDARWDVAVLRSRSDPTQSAEKVVQAGDLARVQRALDAAHAHAKSNALRTSIDELKTAYSEKADLVTRFQRASADSRVALDAAMRADAAVSGLVRTAWRDFPQRERLVAVENLVARVLTEAQQYHHTPGSAARAALEAAAGDLPLVHSLPRAIESALLRLESDVHQVLLLKPLEQTLGERLTVLDTAARADALAQTYQRHLGDALAERSRYRLALIVYSIVLLLAGIYFGRRLYRRYRALEAAVAAHEAASAEEITDVEFDEETGAPNVHFIRRP